MKRVLSDKHITVLSGAGISVESGIPTFRGPEGYWSIGSSNYHPQDMATHAMFLREPDEVWKWYLYRLSVYRHAKPNPAHLILVEFEQRIQHRFTLITQNVDNLHLVAGSSPERTLQIHGNIYYMRCLNDCRGRIYAVPLQLMPRDKQQNLSDADRKLLVCPDCGARSRPHVLWFDESYNERYYRFESALSAAEETDVLVIAGTSGATTLPNLIASTVYRNAGAIIEINIQQSPFTGMALDSKGGKYINKTCSAGLSEVLAMLDDRE